MSSSNSNIYNINKIFGNKIDKIPNNKSSIKKSDLTALLGNFKTNYNSNANAQTIVMENSKENMKRFQFNLMYLKNTDLTKRFFEIYTTYAMLLSTVENIKYYLQLHRDDLYEMTKMDENLMVDNAVYKKDNLKNKSLLGSKFNENFFNSEENLFNKNVRFTFGKYIEQPSLVSFEYTGLSKIPLYQNISNKYIKNKFLKIKVLPQLFQQYNLFKTKLIDLLRFNKDEPNEVFLYGILGFSFLFTNGYFPLLTPNDPNNVYMNPTLFDLANLSSNINDEIKILNNRTINIMDELANNLIYFYKGLHKESVLYETIIRALDMDVLGIQLPLFFVHPKYMSLFLKRKYKIDNQINNLISSYDLSNVPQIKNDENISFFKDFVMSGDNSLFKSYDEFS